MRGEAETGLSFGEAPAGVDLVKGARRRRIRAHRPLAFLRALSRAAPPPPRATPRAPAGRRPQIVRQPPPTGPPSAPQTYIIIFG